MWNCKRPPIDGQNKFSRRMQSVWKKIRIRLIEKDDLSNLPFRFWSLKRVASGRIAISLKNEGIFNETQSLPSLHWRRWKSWGGGYGMFFPKILCRGVHDAAKNSKGVSYFGVYKIFINNIFDNFQGGPVFKLPA